MMLTNLHYAGRAILTLLLFFLIITFFEQSVAQDQSFEEDQLPLQYQFVARVLWQHRKGQILTSEEKPDTAIDEFQGCVTDVWPHKYQCMGVVLVRRGCDEGLCPNYELQLNGNGRVVYKGIANTEKVGMRTGRVDLRNAYLIFEYLLKYQDIFAEMENARPLLLEDEIGGMVVTTLVKLGSKSKLISYDGSRAPVDLLVLHELIDAVIWDVKWNDE